MKSQFKANIKVQWAHPQIEQMLEAINLKLASIETLIFKLSLKADII